MSYQEPLQVIKKKMEVINLLEKIGIHLTMDSHFSVNGQLQSASFNPDQLKNSCFEYDFKRKKILHFTTLESSRLITTSRYLRGSNLSSLNDNFEVIHGTNIINENLSNNWNKFKDRSFAICFTELKGENVSNNYEFHWNNYANNYKGVALEFEFTENYIPYDIFPLKVLYINKGNKRVAPLEAICNEITMLSEAEKEFILPILASIKSTSYKDESEVRIFHNIHESSISHIPNNSKEYVYYSFKNGENKSNELNLELRIPFHGAKQEGTEFLKLNKIYLGKNILNSQDNVASSIIMDHFEQIENEGLAEIKW